MMEVANREVRRKGYRGRETANFRAENPFRRISDEILVSWKSCTTGDTQPCIWDSHHLPI